MLKELQFTVIEADNGSRALDIVDTQPDIDLLFTDIVMPGMNGFELGRLARERRPQLPVLYATGYSASYTAHREGRRCVGEAVSRGGSADEAARAAHGAACEESG